MADLKQIAAYAARYEALREVGVAPADWPGLEQGNVLRFTNLDEHADALIARRRGPAKSDSRCDYLAAGICNKCGRTHDGGVPVVGLTWIGPATEAFDQWAAEHQKNGTTFDPLSAWLEATKRARGVDLPDGGKNG